MVPSRIRLSATMKIKITLLLFASLLLYSCATKLVYNHFDWVLEWYVDDLVSLSEDQEWQLRGAIESTLKWHRSNQLPFYIETLEEAEYAVNNEINVSFLKRFYFAHEKGWMDLKYHVTPTLAGLLTTLTTSQIDELQKNMESQEKELTEKYVDKPPDKLIRERTERMIDRLEDWVDDLNKNQQQIVVNWSNRVKPGTNEWAGSRREWQSNFIKIVRDFRNNPQFNTLMMEHFQNSRKYWPEGYEATYYSNINITLEMIAELGKTLSKDQKKHLLKRIGKLKEQFNELYKDD